MFLDKKAPRRRPGRREKLLFVLVARIVPDWRGRCFAFTPRTLIRWKRQWVAVLMRSQNRFYEDDLFTHVNHARRALVRGR